jgi:hypothetical protein
MQDSDDDSWFDQRPFDLLRRTRNRSAKTRTVKKPKTVYPVFACRTASLGILYIQTGKGLRLHYVA